MITRFSVSKLSSPARYRSLVAGYVVPSSYELISTTVLGSSAASVTFSGLGTSAAAYKHLQIRLTARTSRADVGDFANIRFNSDTGANYAYHGLVGGGASVSSYASTSATSMEISRIAGGTDTANVFGAAVIDVLDWQGTKNKTVRGLGGEAAATYKQVGLFSGVWLSTTVVTSITVLGENANFVTGSRFSLYGLRG